MIKKLAGLMGILLLSSCSFDYGEFGISEEAKALIPDVELTGLVESVYENGNRVLSLSASVMRTFDERQIQELEELEFRQFDRDGVQILEGQAEFASRDTVSGDILLSGQVHILLNKESTEIFGEQFVFSDEQQLVWAPGESESSIVLDDGSRFRGQGFIVDILRNEMRFDGGAEGTLVIPDDSTE